MGREHTPGPWEWLKPSYVGCYIETTELNGPSGNVIAVEVGFEDFSSRMEIDVPNARLIAAAPELLAALEGLVEQEEDFIAARMPGPALDLTTARAAIAKARGGG